MGQYLQPTPYHLPVDRWVTPEEFAEHAAAGEAMGIRARRGRPARAVAPTTRARSSGARATRAHGRALTRESEEPACKPDPVRGARAPPATISLGGLARRRVAVRRRRAAYPGARTGRPRTLPAWPCSGRGLPSRAGRPPRWWALTPPFHPYRPPGGGGGLLSVAPSRGRPRLALASILPCGVRTFLDPGARPGPRPPGRLLRDARYRSAARGSPARRPRRGSRARPPRCCVRAGRART